MGPQRSDISRSSCAAPAAGSPGWNSFARRDVAEPVFEISSRRGLLRRQVTGGHPLGQLRDLGKMYSRPFRARSSSSTRASTTRTITTTSFEEGSAAAAGVACLSSPPSEYRFCPGRILVTGHNPTQQLAANRIVLIERVTRTPSHNWVDARPPDFVLSTCDPARAVGWLAMSTPPGPSLPDVSWSP